MNAIPDRGAFIPIKSSVKQYAADKNQIPYNIQ